VIRCLLFLFALTGAQVQAALVVAPVTYPSDIPRAPAPGMFLVATRYFQDPDFRETVVYLLQHDRHATFGVIINRPTTLRLAERRPELAGTALASLPLHDGGPVNPELTVTLVENRAWENNYDASLLRHVTGGIFASVNPVIIERLLHGTTRSWERVRVYVGHIGWVPDQLEQEIARNYWHLVNGDVDEVFGAEAGSLWERLIERLEPAEPLLAPEVPLNPGAAD
jgi:putative transcriptional regulator